jgi:histidinol-phosphate phosphatase family protein
MQSLPIPLMPKIDKSWSLFLDRDGVINHEISGSYVHHWNDFVFYDGSLEAFRILAGIFHKIIVVTNQRGVGKGLTKLEDLHTIHANMENAIQNSGGRIDAVYYCSDIEDNSPFRKPQPGMGLEACRQFPDIDPVKSIMVGNSISDMGFGRNLGCFNVFLTTTCKKVPVEENSIDAFFPSLREFAQSLR